MANSHEAVDPEKSAVQFPFVVESETELREDPVAGTHGTEVSVVEEECPECGYDRARVAHAVLPGVYRVSCMACETVHEEG